METQEFLQYIETYYPVEYDLVGRSTATKIINTLLADKELEVVTSEEGSNFEILEIISLIALLVETIKSILEIIDHFKQRKEEVTFKKVKEKVLEKLNQSDRDRIDNEDLDELVKDIVDKKRK